ncbi:DUF3291 domain-containing protein [Thalassotalea euphylliae]|uniref:DUF3291 domain-containing protein n=1 Tax=Thalassotalea euphylliae TaxID=1655234 RepID=UPI003632441C
MEKVLAQLNIATALAPLESEQLKEFVDNLDRINGIAEQSPGFIWRLKDDSGNATNISYFDNPNTIINMSLWESIGALKHFMFMTDHLAIMKQKAKWFEKPNKATYVLWWVDKGHIPTIDEALTRLALLQESGDTPQAFSFKKPYPAN